MQGRFLFGKRSSMWIAAAVMVLAPVLLAKADILVTNLSEPFRANTPITNTEFWGAQSFYTAMAPFSVTSISIIGGNALNNPAVFAELRAADGPGLYAEIDWSAGGLISTFSAPDLTGVESVRTFLPNSSISLAADTKYWFILGSTNAGSYDWSYADSGLYSGPGYLFNYADSDDGGATWIYRSNDFPYYLQVDGSSAIPEPTGVLLVAGAVVGLLTTVRRRQR